MQPLEQLQTGFMTSLTGGPAITLGPSRISPEHSLAIYRRNYRENHIQSLADTYEHIVALAGRDYFRQLASRYLATHPGRSGDLNDYGEHFAGFLEELLPQAPGGNTLPYLPDMARLDWARLQVLRAPETKTVALADLITWPPEYQGLARLRLHPACTLLRSDFPLYCLWRLAAGEESTVDLAEGGQSILICRPKNEVQIHKLDGETAYLLEQWQMHTLAKSLVTVTTLHPGADPGAILATLNSFAIAGELWRES